jgi:hypothetical protein
MASLAKRRATAPEVAERSLTEWERKVARSIVRKEERRREECSGSGGSAKLILPSDVCRGFLTGACTSAASCRSAHRVPAEFWAFAAKARKQDADNAPQTQEVLTATAVKVDAPEAPPPQEAVAASDAAVIVVDNALFDVRALQQEVGCGVRVAPSTNVTGRGFAIALGITSKRSLASAVCAIVAAASDDDPRRSVVTGLGCAVSPRQAATVRAIAVVLGGPLCGLVFAAVPLPGPVKEAVATLLGGGASGMFDSVCLVLQRLVGVACGIPCQCVPLDSPRLYLKTTTSVDVTPADAAFASMWCGYVLVPDNRDSEHSRAARAAASALLAM